MRGVRVGEASHPGPVQTRNARRLLSTQLDPDDDPPVRSGRFGPLSSDSDGDHDVHVCRAPTSAVDCERVAVLSGRVVPSAPKRLRLTSRNLRMSQASTLPAAEFDLTRADSDRDIQVAGREERPRSGAGNNILPFEPWVGGTPSSPSDVVAVPPPAILPGSDVPRFREVDGGGSETDTVGSRITPQDVPDQWDQDTDDSDTDSVAGSVRQEDTVSVVDDPADIAMPRAPTLRHAFRNMDDVDVERIFSLRASVMRSVPRFLHGPFRKAMKMVLEEIMASVEDVRVTRGWKVLLMLPRLLLHRPPGGGVIYPGRSW